MLVIVDIDGTVADVTRRLKKAPPHPGIADRPAFTAWIKEFHADLIGDDPIAEVCALLKSIKDCHIIYLTSRSEEYRAVTLEWLEKHDMPDAPLYMRANGDWSETHHHKKKILETLVKVYDRGGIAIDDDYEEKTSDIYRELGFIHLKVMT